jgi:hypothetical protein
LGFGSLVMANLPTVTLTMRELERLSAFKALWTVI